MYTLSFEYYFQHSDDEVYFAYNYPYTYTDLRNYLDGLQTTHESFLRRSTISRTLAGNRIDVLTITNPKSTSKKGIIITARLHPGETVSSFVAKGIIDFLLSSDAVAAALRDAFVFKIVPMMNPDGVIHGNYRTSLAGRDLNRRWSTTTKEFEPEIYNMKAYFNEFATEHRVVLCCDLHGHSRKKSSFAYACLDELNSYRTR